MIQQFLTIKKKSRLSIKVTFAKGSKMEMTLFFDKPILTGNLTIKCKNKKISTTILLRDC